MTTYSLYPLVTRTSMTMLLADQAYHRLLVWDIASAPKLTRWTEKALNPVLGKSLVVYATKPARVRAHVRAEASA